MRGCGKLPKRAAVASSAAHVRAPPGGVQRTRSGGGVAAAAAPAATALYAYAAADETQPCYSSAYMDAANTAFMQLGVRGVSPMPCRSTTAQLLLDRRGSV